MIDYPEYAEIDETQDPADQEQDGRKAPRPRLYVPESIESDVHRDHVDCGPDQRDNQETPESNDFGCGA